MAAILGMRGTGSFDSTHELPPYNYREKILREYPDGPTPLLMILGMLKNEAVRGQGNAGQFAIFEQGLPTDRWACDSTTNPETTDTRIHLDDAGAYTTTTETEPGKFFKVGHLVRSETSGEVMLVTAIDTSYKYIDVKRGVGGDGTVYTYGTDGPAAISAGDFITIIGNANMEGAGKVDSPSEDPSVVFNYIQEFRHTYGLTELAKRSGFRTGDQLANRKYDASMRHNTEMEKAFLFGKREIDTSGAQPRRMTGGLDYWLGADYMGTGSAANNYTDFSSTGLSKDGFEDAIRDIYTVPGGSQNKVGFCGNQALGIINRMGEAHNTINVEPRDKTFGLQIRTFVHAWGELKLIAHPLMTENAAWNSTMFIVDTRNIAYRYVPGNDTHLKRNVHGNDEWREEHEWRTMCGLELQHQRTHGMLEGITSFLA